MEKTWENNGEATCLNMFERRQWDLYDHMINVSLFSFLKISIGNDSLKVADLRDFPKHLLSGKP